MKLRLLISLLSISVVSLAPGRANAQSADDFFHSGARSYLSNNIPGAKEVVSNGLARFPDDTKLKKLDELLKQQQQNQQQNQQQQQNQSQQNQSQSKQDQKQSQDQKQKEQQNQQQKNQQKQGEDQQKKQQLEAGQMSPEQAKQLMDQQKADEMLLPNSRKEKPHDQNHPIKDW